MNKSKLFFTDLLENKEKFISDCLDGKMSKELVRKILLFSFLSLTVYGAIIGSDSFLQATVSAIKVPLIFFLTPLICFPTLYLFLALLGVRYNLAGLGMFTLLCLFLMSVVLLAFSPLSLFFVIIGTEYELVKMINVLIMSISGFTGVIYL